MSPARPRRLRTTVVAGLALAVTASTATLMTAAPAHAAPVPFIVIGTSDVSDSYLVQKVIEPGFEALYPQYDLQYVAQGTGAAIDSAKAGNGAALIVHAAALENQFVAQGYSLEPAGRLAFWGDYVLAGPANDPAGVTAGGGANDVVTAFEKIAAAGAAGNATFVARGAKPGTATQERALWALTSGVTTCTVSATDGGGARPANASGPCQKTDDTDQTNDPTAQPTWYRNGNSASQATNVNLASTCNTATYPNGNCYVFTDRGTLKYLQSTGVATNLKILTRNNAATARGGREALINVFHAYGVNPAKVPATGKTDATAAKLFLDYLTSTSTQAQIGSYLSDNATDPTFIPSAAPELTAALKQDTLKQGRNSKIKGNVANAVPGYPVLNGVTVNLLQTKGTSPLAVPKVVATTTTDSAGNYKLKHELKGGFTYRVGVPAITKLELPNLNPQFSDILAAASSDVGVAGGLKVKAIKRLGNGRFVLTGKSKAEADGKGKVKLFAGKSAGSLKRIGKVTLKDGKTRFTFRGKLPAGTSKLQLSYSDTGDTIPATSKVFTVKL